MNALVAFLLGLFLGGSLAALLVILFVASGSVERRH